ncbi:Oidioi.mRNA.OKI2018_I69.PAR.g13014.t1.cds [Oikopleura dioica]|uniref:Oidioi.mRNA.OKI2018_I69.PAR.g13014.t1.cds n=1 Tax=Oikopleura dioica TaxID=34765 RepID=A0ABN7S9K6_OIKDI|nr:Oidioi.mRNA.OKI2018_I69.PAR.g13014.t1.cds [Oikopleura dioica]
MSLEELYSLYEKNVNEPNRKKTLTAISNHPNANLLAELIFKRMDRTDYVSAKNQLLPIENDEHGPFDNLLGEHQCDWILELMAREDYVINLIKEEFQVKYDREPSSLSDIVKIACQREMMVKSPVPKAVFETKDCHCDIGSSWIVTYRRINGVDEQQRVGTFPYIYKILRAPEIRLERLRLPIGYPRNVHCLLFEPFLIIFDRKKRIDVFNLLKPNEQPKSITGEGELIEPKGYYKADLRRNGKILDNVIFPIVRREDGRTICVDFALISRSSVDVILHETIKLPEKTGYAEQPELKILDRDNFLLRIDLRDDEDMDGLRGCVAFLIITSKKKIISYSLPYLSGFPEFAMIDGRLGMIVWSSPFDDYNEDNTLINFAAFAFLSENSGLEVICFFKYHYGRISIRQDRIMQLNVGESKDTIVFVEPLINHLEKTGQARPSLTKAVNGHQVTRPIVEIESLLYEKLAAETVTTACRSITSSCIGRAVLKSWDMTSDQMEIQIYV